MADRKVATEDLYVGSIIVHRAGTELSVEEVEEWGWKDQVVGAKTKTAAEIQATPQPDMAVGAATVAETPSTPESSKRAANKTNP